MRTSSLVISLLIALVLSLGTSAEKLEKRNCSIYKRNVLDKRNYEKKCKCSVAKASFTGQYNYVGFNSFFQNECGETKIFGQYYGGFYKGVNYTFSIIDECGNTLVDLGDMNIVVNDKGGTEPFANTFDFNLDCDKNGILSRKPVYKRHCYTKRQGGGPGMKIEPGDATASVAY